MKPTQLTASALTLAELTKSASEDSSFLGRYFASGPVLRSKYRDRPDASQLGAIAGSLVPYGGLWGSGEIGASLFSDVRNSSLEASALRDKDNTYGGVASRGARNARILSLLLAAAGAGGGAYLGGGGEEGDLSRWQGDDLKKRLALGALGAALGGGLGYGLGQGLGALGGVYDKAVLNNVSDASIRRIAKVKKKSPFATALPLGDVVGASLA